MDDKIIVQLYWDRDASAIEETSKKYGNYCHTIARNIVSDDEDARECVNDTWLAAWRSMPPHRPAILSAFLGRITRNLAFNRWKENHRQKRGGGQQCAVLDELAECVSSRETVEQEIEYQQLVNDINDFLASLSAEKRAMFVCRYWYTDSVADIAKRFGLRENTVTKSLQRTRAALRQHLQERGYHIS